MTMINNLSESTPHLKQVAFYRLNNKRLTDCWTLGIKNPHYHKFNKISKIANSLDSAENVDFIKDRIRQTVRCPWF